jgi:hypothetical protein
MPWGVAAAVVGGVGAHEAAKTSAQGSKDAAALAAQGSQDGLAYQLSQEEAPSYYREQALSQLGDYYGLGTLSGSGMAQSTYDDALNTFNDLNTRYESVSSGRSRRKRGEIDKDFLPQLSIAQGELDQAQAALDTANAPGQQQSSMGGQQGMIDQVQQSPFYQSMIDQGADQAARYSQQTGGLRSGGANLGFAQNSQNVLQGMVGQRLGGLQTMAGMGSNANAIAGSMANIGGIQGMGSQAAAQAQQQGTQNMYNAIGQGMNAWGNRPTKELQQNAPIQQQSLPQYQSAFGQQGNNDQFSAWKF